MSDEFKSKLPELEIHPDDHIERDQVVVWFLAQEYGKWSEVMTLGNISTMIGKAKSRKTFFITLLIVSIIKNKSAFMKSNLTGRKIVLFDTEQGKFHVWKICKRIMIMLGIWPENLKVYGLRPLTTKERMQEIENYIGLESPELVFIDGIRDLVTDINSAEQATEIVGKLMNLSYTVNCHICGVIHQNKGDDNARGHIGSELMNKSETVLQVLKQKEISTVSAVFCRGMEPKDLNFRIKDNIPMFEEFELQRTYMQEKDDQDPF
jgi:hypothetical protein